MTIGEALELLDNAEVEDTVFSKDLFWNYEEGLEDAHLVKKRRDWLVIADIYNDGNYTQNFHMRYYLEYKLHTGLTVEDDFEQKCYRYFNNVALILYTREIIFGEEEEALRPLYDLAKDYYQRKGKINNKFFTSKMRRTQLAKAYSRSKKSR